MNVHVNGLSIGTIVALAGIALLVSLGIALIPYIIERIAGRRRDPDHFHNRSRFGFFRSRLLAAMVLGVLLMFIVRARTAHTVSFQESSELAADVNLSLHEAMQDLSEARQDIRNAVRDVTSEIPVEIARIASVPPNPDAAAETAVTITSGSSNSQQAVVPVVPPESHEVATAVVTTVPALPAAPASIPSIAADEQLSQPAGPGKPAEPVTTINSDAPSVADAEELRKRKSELAAHIGQWIQSLRSKSPPENGGEAGEAAQAAESANGDVVVLQLSDQMVEQLLGESGQNLLKSFNAELPGRIRQTYALIPLTPAVDAAVSPMRPLLANGGLEAIANSLVTLLERADSAIPVEQPSATTATDAAVALTAAPTVRTIPDWVLKPDGGRTVVETDSLLPDDDSQQPLMGAINGALAKHLSGFTQTLDPVLRNQSRFVKLELDRESAAKCIVKTFERHEQLETGQGDRQSFRKIYALLDFPESVDNMALQKIRQSLQYDRMTGLGTVVLCVWLSICLAGCSIRTWRNGTRMLRVIATPIAGIASLSLLLFATGFVMALSTVDVPRFPWLQKEKAVQIHLDEAV